MAIALGYRLDQDHVAAVSWTTEPDTAIAELERTGRDLAGRSSARDTLRLVASAGTVWVWLAGVDLEGIGSVEVPAHLRAAVGTAGTGMEGFRRSHFDAVSTQRMLARLQSTERVATLDDVEAVLALTEDLERADAFVRRPLGSFEATSPELRETVLVYIRQGQNAQRTAARLFAHRNTVLRRLKRADELLPRPLRANAVKVGLALEVLRWRGTTGAGGRRIAQPGRASATTRPHHVGRRPNRLGEGDLGHDAGTQLSPLRTATTAQDGPA